ncbi:MAG: hypothetical protein WC819_00765 [Parcubacteria group bacterium]|jgi:hypothetical protein
MIAHLRSLLFTIVFFIGVELIITFSLLGERKGLVLGAVLLLFALYAGWNVGKSFIYAFFPFALALASFGLLYFIDNFQERQIFSVLVSILYYATLLGIKRICKNPFDMTARSLFSAALIATIFLFYAVVYGFYINFNIPLWLFMATHFVFVSTITFVSLRSYSSDIKRILLYSTIIAFVMIQFVWMTNFWPFGYLTMAAINLMFYYILWDMVQMVFLETLSKRRILISIIYCIILTVAVLFTTQWLLVD